MKMSNPAQQALFAAIFNNPKSIHDIPDGKLKQEGEAITHVFTETVDKMRNGSLLPLPKINELMALFWDLVGQKVFPAGVSPIVTRLSFGAAQNKNSGKLVGAILCPTDWVKRMADNPVLEMGGMVFVASQARDMYNDKLDPKDVKRSQDEIVARARAFEAEFLIWASQNIPGYDPDDYQKNIVKQFPRGLDSCDLFYESREFSGPL